MPHFYGTTHSRETRRTRLTRTVVRPQPTHEEISRLAYSFWEARGRPHGSSLEDWLRAERELQGRSDSEVYW